MSPLRIKGVNIITQDGIAVISKHVERDEFDRLRFEAGSPHVSHISEDGVPGITFHMDGIGWKLSINCWDFTEEWAA